jgi:hypothetical protein
MTVNEAVETIRGTAMRKTSRAPAGPLHQAAAVSDSPIWIFDLIGDNLPQLPDRQ